MSVVVDPDGHGLVYEFSPEMTSAVDVTPGSTVTVKTRDSLEGAVQTEHDTLDDIPEQINPATGPIGVEEATPGDILAVTIEDIRITTDQAPVAMIDGFGVLDQDESIETPKTLIADIHDNRAEVAGVEFPLNPLIGTMGVAPETGTYSTLLPHDHGGNLDSTDLTTGTTVYFPVFQQGGQLALGDCKAAMADGETCASGIEVPTAVDLTIDVISNPHVSLQRPLLETNEFWKTVASDETVEMASKLATRDLVALIESEHEISQTEAYALAGLRGGLEIGQIVNPLATVRYRFPKEQLQSPLERGIMQVA